MADLAECKAWNIGGASYRQLPTAPGTVLTILHMVSIILIFWVFTCPWLFRYTQLHRHAYNKYETLPLYTSVLMKQIVATSVT